MEDVASRAGVSRALVSIVFRDQPGASAATRARVRAAAAAIGYVPDQRARLLGRRRTGLLGVAFGLRLDFHGQLVEELYRAADAAGFGLALSAFGPSRSETEATASLVAYRCEGLVLVGPTGRSAALGPVAGTPTVVLARAVQREGIVVVRTDDRRGARLAAEHLIGLGHRHLVHVDGGRAPGAAERRQGFRRAVERAGLSGSLLAGGLTEAEGLRAGDVLVRRRRGRTAPTGVVAFNDRCAFGLVTALRRAGARVPEDLSVVGFDDSRLAALPGVDLTTIRQDAAGLADHAVAQILARLPGAGPARATREIRETVVAPELVVRSTTIGPAVP